MIISTITAASGEVESAMMNERSTFSRLAGIWSSRDSEESSTPKSSIASRKPSAVIWRRRATVLSKSRRALDSVISTTKRLSGTPAAVRLARMEERRFG